MNNWKVILATAVIFGAGVITGGLLVNYVQQCHLCHERNQERAAVAQSARAGHAVAKSRGHVPESRSEQFMRKLNWALKLNPKQRVRIRKIILNGQNQIRKVLEDSRQEIRRELNPGQRKKFDKLFHHPHHQAARAADAAKPAAVTNASPAR